MKHSFLILVPSFALLFFSCARRELDPASVSRDLSVPEKVDSVLLDVLSRDWKGLSDTLDYFNSNLLSKGKSRGMGPDGVYYKLDLKLKTLSAVELSFSIEDTVRLELSGHLPPLEIRLKALDTEMIVRSEGNDSSSISVSDVKLVAPLEFLFSEDHRASLLYKGQRVGYVTRESFENTDYSTGTYLLIHYYGDNRSFALYDNGLGELLKTDTDDIFD